MLLAARRPRLPRAGADAALAGVLLAAGLVQVATGWNGGGVGAPEPGTALPRAALVAACTVPLVWRRTRPMTVVAIVCLAVAVQVLAVGPFVPFLGGLLPMLVANYSAAAYGQRWRIGGLVAVCAAEAVLFARIPEERVPGELLFALFVALGSWVVGDLVRTRISRADRAVGAARSLVAEREAAAATALADERARIARELHDVIAHSVSVMGVQAGAARTLLDSDPDAARAAVRSIEETARESVAELQRLLAVLREGEPGDDDRAPQPGLADLPRLVEQVRAAGLPVRLTVPDALRLPPGVDLAAYRIVQEALTNALKHSGAPTDVTLACDGAQLRIEVCDPGGGPSRAAGSGGHGLVGMRERAQLYGGRLDAGPAPGGGFLVRAVLPVGSAP